MTPTPRFGFRQDEINAMQQLKGQSRAPDVLDMGTSFAIKADQLGLLAPYKVATWSAIPANSRGHRTPAGMTTTAATWRSATTSAKVKVPPTSFADLLKPIYKNQVAINGNPTQASAAFSAVYASALANGGSLSNIGPGHPVLQEAGQAGNFLPAPAGPTTVQSGRTPIVVWWDYLLASDPERIVPTFKIVIPTDAHYAAYYGPGDQQDRPEPGLRPAVGGVPVLDHRPEPVAAGQGAPDRAADARQQRHGQQDGQRGAACGSGKEPLNFPTQAQESAAKAKVAQQWSSVIG